MNGKQDKERFVTATFEAYYHGYNSVSWSPVLGLEISSYDSSTRRGYLSDLKEMETEVAKFLAGIREIQAKINHLEQCGQCTPKK